MGKKSQKSTTTSTPWQPAQGDILGAIGTVRDTVGANQGNLQNISDGISGQLPGLASKAFGDNPLLNSGNNYVSDVLGGKYLNSNPYMDQMIGATDASVRDQVNSMFGQSGASLGTPYAGAMTQQLANAENQLRYGDYSQERQNQQQAAGMVPGQFAAQFAGIPSYLSAAQTAGTLPYAGLGALSPIIGMAGGSGTQTGTQPSNFLSGLLGAGASLGSAAIMASARELKTDIEEIGEWDDRGDGLKKFRFRYKNDPSGRINIGVMADDVKRLRPAAYVPNFIGDKPGVNYALLGVA